MAVDAVVIVTDGETQVDETANHGGNLITAADGQVAETVATVGAALAIHFAPELVAPALQRKFQVLDDGVTCAQVEACLRPFMVPVIVEAAMKGSLACFLNREIVPSCECCRGGDSCCCDNFLEHKHLLSFSNQSKM